MITERKLSYQARKHLPSGSFVFPGQRRYPIENKPHARNALARVAQHGSSSEKARVRSAVHSKYPDIGEGLAKSKWLKGAIKPSHKGYCTPMSKATCTPRRKALAMRFKHGDLHQDSLVDQLIPAPPLDEHCGHCPEDYARRRLARLRAGKLPHHRI